MSFLHYQLKIIDFSDFLNQKISIPVGAMAIGRNVIFYVAKGAKPELAKTM